MRDTAIPNKSKSQLISICKLKLVKMFYKQKANITEKEHLLSQVLFLVDHQGLEPRTNRL